ncbi:hypothetical protein D7D52_10050 [Nocardia yunnanensis]|uniref:Lipoprotein n=1 Tax=Nocardia yunnanensis TaxID=2382165 RepID=A0A386Z974_9NOCA|nr:hypothetical protein [Nocardia yunnanensis]AYF74148.1 hypothetical protein D7D52_10050 [Nocardia yunnanensis]
MFHWIPGLVTGTVVLATVTACGSSGTSTSGSPETNPAGDIPDSTVFVPYAYPAGNYSVKVPQGWARTDRSSAVVFTDKLNTITLTAVPAPAAPTVVSARDSEVPAITAAGTNVHVTGVATVQRAGETVVQISYSADSAPDPVTGKVVRDAVERYEYFRNGTEAIVTLAGPVGADNADPWMTVSDSLRWTS